MNVPLMKQPLSSLSQRHGRIPSPDHSRRRTLMSRPARRRIAQTSTRSRSRSLLWRPLPAMRLWRPLRRL